MALTESILKRVIFARLPGISVTDIDQELLDTLYDISSRANFLKASTTQDTVDGTADYTEPTNLKEIEEIHISEDKHFVRATYDDYLNTIQDTDSPTEGEPEKYCRWNGKIYMFDPIPDDTYTATIDYYKFHSGSLDDFEFDNRFREAIVHGTLARLWGGQLSRRDGAIAEIQLQKGLCSEQVALLDFTNPEPFKVPFEADCFNT